MENTIVQLSKYVITFLMICFTVQSFAALKERDEDERHYILMRQIIMIILMNFICFFVMFLQEGEVSTIQMFLLTMAYILGVQILYRLIYRKASMILVNNMCMLLSISMIILTRLSVSKAMSQYKILAASTLLCFIIPVIVRKGKFLKNLTWIYAVLGIAMLSVVMVLGFTSGGAKLSIEIHGITFQLSEIAKITLVFFMAGMLREDNSFGNVVKATVIAAVHVLILVASTDLGTAFVFFMAYVVVIYVATRKARYPLLGLAGMSAACVVAYFLFSHVRNRVALWQDPIGNWDISSQLAQGLFGMCSGGWFGTGLFEGRPDIIPVATKDFIFCAICEEMGIIFGICLILLCMSTFLLIINISMKMSKRFYKLIAMGLGTEYATQVFLTIGGTIKFIPMTGITLPLVSYGGSSMFSTVLMLSSRKTTQAPRKNDARTKRPKDERRAAAGTTDREPARSTASSRMNSNGGSKSRPRTASTGKAANNGAGPYLIVSFLFVAMFLGLIAYLVYFNVVRKEEFLNSSYNTRQNNYAERVIRGTIYSADGQELAKTTTDENGDEVRTYPFGSLFAQVVGYTGKGNSGLESSYNYMLMESHTSKLKQVKNEFSDAKNPGDSLYTTLNTTLQQAAADALDGYRGAVVVLEAKTGRVLANVSNPVFNPNTIDEDWEALNADDESGVFLNRGLQGRYPPGSTFKIVTSLAYLRQNGTLDGFSFDCDGELTAGNYTIHCSGGEVHGPEDFAGAFAHSCNSAFAQIGLGLDKDAFRSLADSLYLNSRLDLELPTSKSSFDLDSTTADALVMQTSIGQGDTLVTPMEMALIASAVANDGEMIKPRYVDNIVSADGQAVKTFYKESLGTVMSESEANTLTELMKGVVQSGTAVSLSDLPYNIAGKTGTAEHGSDGETPHSWFVGFSNADDPDIVIAVVAENGGYSSEVAVPIARQVIEAYYAQQ